MESGANMKLNREVAKNQVCGDFKSLYTWKLRSVRDGKIMVWVKMGDSIVMIQDLTISYVEDGIETTLTIKDGCYSNMPYILADMFVKIIQESDANPQIVIEKLKTAFGYDD